MNKLSKGLTAIICIELIIGSLCVTNAYAIQADDAIQSEDSQVYVGDSYDESYEITPFERGRRTDSYSKAWCNSHGFKNNRPVPHKVQLNAKERKCLNELYVNGTASVIAGYISTGAGGALFATAQAAYRLFNCLF